jgi:serine protease inhibitor
VKTGFALSLAIILSGGWSYCLIAQTDMPSHNERKIAESNSRFAIDLYGQLRAGDGNLFCSPYSASAALAMTYAGARGETATQMAKALEFDLPESEVHPAFAELQESLNAVQEKGQVQFAIANSLWPQSGLALKPDFLALCQKYYDTSIRPVDYEGDTEGARKIINDWVEQQTNRKITDLLKPGMLLPATRLVLVNAIYFKGKWDKPFDSSKTQDQPFHVSADQTITAPLMYQKDDFGYAEFPDLQVLELPYRGHDLSMVVLLPRDANGLGALETKLTADNLAAWTKDLSEEKVCVFLPKFTTTQEFSLSHALMAMGMTDAFSRKADFSGMDGRKDLFISEVIQKAFVKVDEEGTEAAAATGVVMLGMAVQAEKPIPVFRADHPFLFLIRDNRTDSILFLGRIINPTE